MNPNSSNINESIKAVFFFFTERFQTPKKHKTDKKYKKHKKHKKRKMQIRDFHSEVFICKKSAKSTKITKDTKHQRSDFLLLRCFYAHENTVFLVHIKNIKTQISE